MISTKTSTITKETVVKEVSTCLNINKRHVKTHVKADIDGKIVWDEEGHSILSNFGRYLEHLMCGTRPEALVHRRVDPLGTVARSSGNLRLVLDGNPSFTPEQVILIYAPDYPDLHLVKIPVTSYSTSSPYTITTGFDISSSAYDDLVGQVVPFSAMHSSSTYYFSHPSDSYPGTCSETAHLRVGVNGSAVAIDDRHVFIPELDAGATTVTFTSNTDLDESYLTFSASFTNSTVSPISIREVILRTAGGKYTNGTVTGNAWSLLLARDVIDEITIPVGRTLTVAYTIMSKIDKATGTGGGNIDSGFTNNLLSGLSGIISSPTQQAGTMIQDNGVSVTFSNYESSSSAPQASYSFSNWMFCGSSPSRASSRFDHSRHYAGIGLGKWRPGVVLCSAINSTQDISNYTIASEIGNGAGSGELLYLQSWGEEGVETVSDYSFTIKRLVYNVSGADIEVKALALMCAGQSTTPYSPGSVGSHTACLLAQTNLDSTDFFTIPNGKMCIVSYTIKVEV